MIVTCTNCNTGYTVDEKKFTQNRMKVRCRGCGTAFTVEKPVTGYERVEYSEEISVKPEQKSKNSNRFGLFPRTTVLMLIISLVPVGLFFGVTYYETGERVRNDTQNLMLQATSGYLNHIDEWVDKNRRVLETASRLISIQQPDRFEQTAVLETIQEQYPWMYLVFITDANGMNTVRSDGKSLTDYSDRAYFKDIKAGSPFSWQTLIGKTSKKPALVMAVPIVSHGEITGVLAAAMTTETISQSVAKWRKGKTGFAFLVDEKNKVIAHPMKGFVLEEKNLADHPVFALSAGHASGFGKFTNEAGEPTIASFKKNSLGWNLVLRQEKREAYDMLTRLQRYFLIFFLVTIVVVATIAWVSAKAVSRPILEMTDATTRMSMGDLDVRMNIRSTTEIGMLAESIGRMQTSLAYAMKRLKRN